MTCELPEQIFTDGERVWWGADNADAPYYTVKFILYSAHIAAMQSKDARIASMTAERDTARAETAMAFEVAVRAVDDCKKSAYTAGAGLAPVIEAIRAITPTNATAALAARDKATREQALRDAAEICSDYGFSRAEECAESILALI